MQIIADLQLHSHFSRAVSPAMTIPNIAAWARRKGIGLVATGDWMHPMWFREIERDLVELGNGLLQVKSQKSPTSAKATAGKKVKSPHFMLATEVSSIYSQGGKVRRVHTLIWVPTIASARKISQEMTKRGCNLMSDGRPIVGLSCIHIAELVLAIEPKALIIPAHCLLPDSMILGDNFVPKRIDKIVEGDGVLTHTGELHSVTEVKKRSYKGFVLHVQPWYFRPGLVTTPEHPYYAIQTIKKCSSTGDICRPSRSHLSLCKRKECLKYKPAWVKAEDLTVGDMLVYPRSQTMKRETDMYLDVNGGHESLIRAGGTRGRVLKNRIPITSDLGRLVGYYIAEGSTDGDNSFSFCFSEKEQEYIDDVVQLVKNVLGIDYNRLYRRKQTKGVEIIYYSKLHAQWFAHQCYTPGQKHSASNKMIPSVLLMADAAAQAECLRGWYRGDRGYTTSRMLVHQMKAVCLRLGIIPSIIINNEAVHQRIGNHKIGNRVIKFNYDLYSMSNLSFFEDAFDLKKEMPKSQTTLDRRHGWIDKMNVYLPIKEITKKVYEGDVYNLEVEKDHSYIAEYAVVHNCWTPWFSVYGEKGGFESLDEAFGPYAKHIYAIETGLSSNPAMNWRIKELDHRSILSFSDAHSGPKLGREATVFETSRQSSALSYQMIYDAIRSSSLKTEDRKLKAKIAYTIEFYPEEGKYHWSGHRACGIRWGPEETAKKGTTCPVCGKPLVQGVVQRVEQLAGRSEESLKLSAVNYSPRSSSGEAGQLSDKKTIRMTGSKKFPNRPPFVMLVPLQEIIHECIGSPVASPKVQGPYMTLTDALGGEFNVLLNATIEEITKVAGARIAEGIDKVRRGDLVIDPGYDGVFGVVKLWRDDEDKPLVDASKEQMSLL
ncbi:MAG: LAGLIDADG family homing endonuclease [Candidatus Gottesmanbacteria bacterium]|nr:LAGLIDADG family homing endonuclease [Candidatus Gottesmanbacteria bacterium]